MIIILTNLGSVNLPSKSSVKFKFYKQQEQRDSGPTCIRMIAAYYGFNYNIQRLRDLSKISRNGVSMVGLTGAARALGFNVNHTHVSPEELPFIKLPCLLNWRLNHYVVLFKVTKEKYIIADPTKGIIRFAKEDFNQIWYSRKEFAGDCLEISPTPEASTNHLATQSAKASFTDRLRHVSDYKSLLFQLLLGFALSSLFQVFAPVLTQVIVDQSINRKDFNLLYLVLIAQLMLALGQVCVNLVRSSILLKISTKINISLLSRFLYKILNLPVSFYENRTEGDLLQRINDQQKIENFLTGTAITTFFSLFNLVIFGFLLLMYKFSIFGIFWLCTLCYAGWMVFFLKPKRELNFLQFENAAMNQSSVIELINGIQDIKLNQAEEQKRWEWERLQVSLFKFKSKLLKVNQLQNIGATLINQIRNILITFLSVKYVIDGQLTLGGMVAIQFIIGQISNPVEQFLAFVQGFQEAKISLDRISEIYDIEDDSQETGLVGEELDLSGDIVIKDLSFTYPIAESKPVLTDINITIPQGKFTAIVGVSGSGKTTILRLLLKFFKPDFGEVTVGRVPLEQIPNEVWRRKCGTVMPDAFIFSDTIANNIALGDPAPKRDRLLHALNMANLQVYVLNLPHGLETRIGGRGSTLSLGQRQRLLIARAVYKNPDFLFFDEATNALDTLNEELVMTNLKEYFKNKTVVVIAHRLSTVMEADQIIVMNNGVVAERGKHQELVNYGGIYWRLVKNQLALSKA